MKAQSVLATIGNTPHIRINRIFGAACQSHQIYIERRRLMLAYDTGEHYLSVKGFLP